MLLTPMLRLCWICDNPLDVDRCKTDEYGEVVHEACHLARLALEKEQLRLLKSGLAA